MRREESFLLEPVTTISDMAGHDHLISSPALDTTSAPASTAAAAPTAPVSISTPEPHATLDADNVGTHIGNLCLFYSGREDDLNAREYKIALSMKIGCLPNPVSFPVHCQCSYMIRSSLEFIDHTMACPEGKLLKGSGVSYTTRHETIKRAALLQVPRSYGINCLAEPKTYQGFYSDGRQGRPDVEYDTFPRIAIDLSIVHPTPGKPPGYNAHVKAQEKIRKHEEAVKAAGNVFAPFVLETSGFLHHAAIQTIKKLSRMLHRHQRHDFITEIKRSVSISLAREKIRALTTALRMTTGHDW